MVRPVGSRRVADSTCLGGPGRSPVRCVQRELEIVKKNKNEDG